MRTIQIEERELTALELERMRAGFDENTVAHGVEIQKSERFDFVALAGGQFAGCISGLAYPNGSRFGSWFNLTDLYVEQQYRRMGIGTRLLRTMEHKLLGLGVEKVWVWTAGYEAPRFYQARGYTIAAELERWYSSGESRIGLRKTLESHRA